jgi:adenosylhomocysteine nucleosidase
MIAVTFALRAESTQLAAQLHEKKINDRRIVIWHTGVGQKHSLARMNEHLKSEHPDYLISSGFAGGVHQDLQAGDLVLADNFSDHELLAKAEQILTGYGPKAVKLFTSATIINSIADRNEIARANNAAAVDMETSVIADACATHGVRMLSLRVITDSLQDPLPVPPAVLFNIDRQQTDLATLFRYLLRHPGATRRLLNFSKQIARARMVLTNATVALLQKL